MFAGAEPDREPACDPGAEPDRRVRFSGGKPGRGHTGPDRFRFRFRFRGLPGSGAVDGAVDRDAGGKPGRGHTGPVGVPGPDAVVRGTGGEPDRAGHPVTESDRAARRVLTIRSAR